METAAFTIMRRIFTGFALAAEEISIIEAAQRLN